MTPDRRVAGYARRFARVPQALSVLLHHPQGLALSTLAAEVGVPEDELRQELIAFFRADAAAGGDTILARDVGLEFLSADGDDVEPALAGVVRLDTEAPLAELGLQYVTAETLGPLYRTALDLAELEPDNVALREAIAVLESTVLAGVEGEASYGGEVAADLRRAAGERRRVRLRYTRAWHPGVVERVVEPYRVVSTRRGFECDAGPVDERGIRTYLVSGIVSHEVLAETFERPADVADLIATARALVDVTLVVPHDGRWAVDLLAERVAVLESDDDDACVTASVLPPVEDRVGLMLLLAGPAAFVTEPDALASSGARLARRLLDHHGLG